MSYVRFRQDGSNVYLYEQDIGEIVCCTCRLNSRSIVLYGIDEALTHIAEHRAAGHHVPEWVDEEIEADRDELDSG